MYVVAILVSISPVNLARCLALGESLLHEDRNEQQRYGARSNELPAQVSPGDDALWRHVA